MTVKTLVCAGLLALSVLAAPQPAQAQNLLDHSHSFDVYRAAAITTGLVAGSLIAVVVTDGLIIPVLATAGGGGGASLGVMRAVLNLFGAVSGGMYADTLYLNR